MRRVVFIFVLALLIAPQHLAAQTLLTTVTFPASPNHATVMADGTAVVTKYQLVITKTGNAAMAPIELGKPTPGTGNLITLVGGVTVPTTLTTGDYTGVILTVGPGGTTPSVASDPFSIPPAPGAAGKPVVRP